ncbi:PREDICTED: leucine-rich repeat and coiled-coil domain-containing protein 1-like [Priapulus caudatus]|uniref:Leucine-rich repeat and coiled-coil domain-containing protein 1-like n=1 Tax=Priapulus caudatus TaxID=37621 RepID=A0ABM1F4Y2_PRICU|nr:PREDICTED: leucine-rich repeat and coiled-coil domain-containing protein 1-like [Priapulus caudatus]
MDPSIVRQVLFVHITTLTATFPRTSGISLVQDRGRLELQVEALTTERDALGDRVRRGEDEVKVKSKIIDDLSDSVRRLRAVAAEKEDAVKACQEQLLEEQREHAELLNNERTANAQLQEQRERLCDRKEQLKQRAADLQMELDDARHSLGLVKSQWERKAEFIGSLEGQVRDMKEAWQRKEETLTQERDRAADAARIATEKLRKADELFQEESLATRQQHQLQMATQSVELRKELGRAQDRVAEVEEEMRELLKETTASKKLLEDKVKH